MVPVVVSLEAEADIEEIGEYIARENPDRAVTFVRELRAKVLKIGLGPNAYPPRQNLAAGLRVAIHGRYSIYFRTGKSEVEVMRIVHGARDLRKIFEK